MRITITGYNPDGELYIGHVDDQHVYIGFERYDDQVVEVFDYTTITYQPDMSSRVRAQRPTLDAAIAAFRSW
jgi:hypothetical protein